MSLSSINVLDISSKPSTPSAVREAGPPVPSSDNATTPTASPPQTASTSRRRVLPNVVLPFYSSIALFGPADKQHAATASATFVKPPPTRPKPFFDAHPTHKRKQRSSIINGSSTAVTSSLPLRSYRRTWPSDSLSSTLNAVCSSLSPAPSVSSAASSVLCMLTFLSRTVARPYDLSLRRLSLKSSPELSALLGSHPVLPAVLAPLLFHLGWERDGDTFVLIDEHSAMRQKLQAVEQELRQLQLPDGARTIGAQDERLLDSAAETGLFHVQLAERKNDGRADTVGAEEKEQEEFGRVATSEDAKYAEDAAAADDETAALSQRRSTIHEHEHRVRPMPTRPTQTRHARYTFREHFPPPSASRHAALFSTPEPPPAPAADTSSSLPHPKALLANVAGERRTLPVTLPTTFLAAAPVVAAAASSSSPRFILQPAFLDLGPLLLHQAYGVSLLVTNTSTHYSRFQLHAPALSSASPLSALSVSVHYRRGGVAGGLQKAVQLVVRAERAGQYEGEVVLEGEGGERASMQLVAEVLADKDEWLRAAEGRDELSAGVLGLTLSSSLPGSLKQVRGDIGRVKPLAGAAEEECKEQLLNTTLLHARILCNRQRNKQTSIDHSAP